MKATMEPETLDLSTEAWSGETLPIEDFSHPQPVLTSLHGKTIEWTFHDGPLAGKTYRHRFNDDGSVDYQPSGARSWTTASGCACTRIGDNVHVVSYLGDGGYTLTAALNTKTGHVVAFASNATTWHQQKGTFHILGEGRARTRRDRSRRKRSRERLSEH